MAILETILPAAASAAIGSAGSIVGSGLSYKKQKKLMNQAYQNDINMWNMQNAYNTPQAQMARLREAGLNPHLAYGNGSVANTSSQAPKYPYSDPNVSYGDLGMSAVVPTLSQFQDIAVKKAQVDNVKANTESLLAETLLKAARLTGERAKSAETLREHQFNARMEQNMMNMFMAKMWNVQANTGYLQERTSTESATRSLNMEGLRQSNLKKSLENNLLRMGISPYGTNVASTLMRLIGTHIDDPIFSPPAHTGMGKLWRDFVKRIKRK